MDFTFTGGIGSPSILDGRARDLLTGADGSTVLLDRASLRIANDDKRIIREIGSSPALAALTNLVGGSSMSGFRGRLAAAVAGRPDVPALLYALLDDVPGSTLVSGAAFRPFFDLDEYTRLRPEISGQIMTDVCTGYQRGSSALNPDGTLRWAQGWKPADAVETGDDRLAWHDTADHAGDSVGMRRARRVDVRVADESIYIDAFYQDSVIRADGGRLAVHEYTLTAEASLGPKVLRAITPVPGVLPYRECPLAVLNARSLIGERLAELRPLVLDRLQGPAGCTHLNDMMRSLADVPDLVDLLMTAASPPA